MWILYLPPFCILVEGFGEAGDDLSGDHRLGSAVAGAVVEHRPVAHAAFIFDQHAVHRLDVGAAALLDGADAKAAGGGLAAKRAGAEPGEADARGDQRQQSEPEGDIAPAGCGALGSFTGRHGFAPSGLGLEA